MSSFLRQFLAAYHNKITNKIWGVVSVRTKAPKKGAVLISYINRPLALAPGEYFTDPHSNYWVTPEIARLFMERGYDVDVIDWSNTKFIPKKNYACIIDIDKNIERLSPLLNKDCIKVYFIIGSHWRFQNESEQSRILALEKRRGVKFPSRRSAEPSLNAECADFIAGYGNKTVRSTFGSFGDKIIPLPIPAMDSYNFQDKKDFNTARKHFLWFGGGGSVLKGLDLVIEAFASLPDLKLTIIGPSAYEKEFEKIYANELKLPNINRYKRPVIDKDGNIKVEGKDLLEIFNQCGAIVYVSASEGGSGSVVHAMQAGLYPIITPESGIDEGAPSVVLENPTVENIRKTVLEFSNLPSEKIKELSRNSWAFARNHYTKKSFTEAFSDFIDNVLKLK